MYMIQSIQLAIIQAFTAPWEDTIWAHVGHFGFLSKDGEEW